MSAGTKRDEAFSRLVYESPLASAADVDGFIMEGSGAATFPTGRLRLENLRDPSEGQKANIVFWCPLDFPPDICIEWDFRPVREPGLCIVFFSAIGQNGKDIFDASLARRDGIYSQYHSSDIDAYHLSYFRRKAESERAFHTCNLRKSYGFHLVAQGADPIPSVIDAAPPYALRLSKLGPAISFSINDLCVLEWRDDEQHGPVLGAGKIGFRQMAPLIAEYANLRVYTTE
ncbi:MAG: DUF1961 family protein [Spirochaetaceae bacterium]|nr:MAG: DUF1961 family protein [Spirochaetaceae bacterium]